MNVRRVLPRDAIPSVDDPSFGHEYGGGEDDLVIVVDGDPARAYPTRVLDFHEVVNDRVDGRPVAVTWCPLCGAGVVYDRRVPEHALPADGPAGENSEDGLVLSFGVSGKLADDDLVLYDRETETEWKQSSGEAIDGPLAGVELSVLPARTTTYRGFRAAHPDGLVLDPPGGESEAASGTDDPAPIDYDRAPYAEYTASEGFGLDAHRGTGGREWNRDDVDPKTPVLGVVRGGAALGFPLDRLSAAGGIATASVGGTDVVVFTVDGGAVAYEDPGHDWARDEGTVHGDGTTWTPSTGESEDGRRLTPVPTRRLFAFAWQDDHGPDVLWRS